MNFQTKTTKGHGFFRKSKAYGLVCGIALTGALVFAGQAHADEVTTPTDTAATTELVASPQEAPAVATQPTSTNDNDTYAKQANTSTGTETVAVDNSVVESAVKEAQDTGVAVSQNATQDQGTPTTSAELDTAKETIKADQDKQVETIKATTAQQAQNNTAYEAAQSAITANNDYVADAQKTYEADTTVSVTTNTATETDGTAKANTEAKKVADSTLDSNKKAVETYVADKKVYDATVASAKTLNDAIEAASTELKKSGATVTTTSQVVHTVDEVNRLTVSNNQKIAEAQAKIKENNAKQEAYNTTKVESDKTNTDANQKADELIKLGATVTTTTKTVTSADEAKAIASQNQQAYDAAKQTQVTDTSVKAESDKTNADAGQKADELSKLDVTVNTTTKTVASADEAKAIANQNQKSYDAAKQAQATDASVKAESDKTNADVSQKESELSNLGITVTTTTQTVSSVAEAQAIAAQNQQAYESVKSKYESALNDMVNHISAEPIFSADAYTAPNGDIIQDSFSYDSATGAFTWTAPLHDNQKFVGYFIVYGTVEATKTFNPTTKKVDVVVSNVNISRAEYKNVAAAAAVDVTDEEWIYDNAGNQLFYTSFNVNQSGSWDINKSYAISQTFSLGAGESTGTFLLSKKTSMWVVGVGSDLSLKFKNDSDVSQSVELVKTTVNPTTTSATITKTTVNPTAINATITKTAVNPVETTPVAVELVKAENPAKPTLALTKLANTKNQQLKASYHNYSLHYKPVVSKSVADTDNANTNGKTVAKGDTEVYKL